MSKKDKAQTSTAVAIIGNTVPDLLGQIKNRLKALKTITETSYKTGGDGKVTGFPNPIQNETSVEQLIKMHSSAFGRAKAYDASQARLQEVAGTTIVAPPFRDNGSTLDSIEADIALRIQVLNVSEEKAELEAYLKEAEGFLTKEDQFSMFKQKLAAKFGLTETTEDAEEA